MVCTVSLAVTSAEVNGAVCGFLLPDHENKVILHKKDENADGVVVFIANVNSSWQLPSWLQQLLSQLQHTQHYNSALLGSYLVETSLANLLHEGGGGSRVHINSIVEAVQLLLHLVRVVVKLQTGVVRRGRKMG